MVKIIILAGQTFQGVHYFEEVAFDVTLEYADYLVREGIARWA